MATDYAGHDATRLPQADDLRMMRATEQQHANGAITPNAALIAEITELKRSRDSFSGMWKRAALENTTLEDENAALTAQVERLTAPMSKEEHERFHHDYVAFQIFDVNGFVAARAAAPATGAEQVHAPKTIVPEPDQRRIETERFPQKGQDNG
jgi:hypothetical protein